MIEAKETHYKNYRFRSRLEARWAVFFDALGIQWEYEQEGFDLADITFKNDKGFKTFLRGGVSYLPDFWIPRHNTFLEIKPGNYDQRIARPMELLSIHSGRSGVVIFGNPCDMAYEAVEFGSHLQEDERTIYRYLQFAECVRCHDVWLYHCDSLDRSFHEMSHSSQVQGCRNGDCWRDYDPKEPGQRVLTAYAAARSARFEYGETPR